jgi:hypothetical protein
MTPFDAYFSTRIERALKIQGAPSVAVKMARASAADIWNAALDAATKHLDWHFDDSLVGEPIPIEEWISELRATQ